MFHQSRKKVCHFQNVNILQVGLNLSLQNGMDLTRQTYYYDGSDFDYGSQQQSNQFDSTQHRNSPLNLEHRCSPLNLTHNKFNQNQYFNFNQNQNYTNYTSYNSEGANYYYCPTTQQQSQDQQHYSQGNHTMILKSPNFSLFPMDYDRHGEIQVHYLVVFKAFGLLSCLI